jgi:hypothetical protein
MTKSNSIELFDTLEKLSVDKNGNILNSSFDIEYIYNYYVQDELEIPSNESSLINAFGTKYDISEFANPNNRPPGLITFSGNIKNPTYPRYVKINITGFDNVEPKTIVTANYTNRPTGLTIIPNEQGDSFNHQKRTPKRNIDNQRKNVFNRLKNNLNLLNDENSLSVGLLDFFIDKTDSFTINFNDFQNAIFQQNLRQKGISEDLTQKIINNSFKDGLKNKNQFVSVLQQAAPSVFSSLGLNPNPEVLYDVKNSFDKDSLTINNALKKYFRNINLDSINDGFTSDFQRTRDIEIKSFIPNSGLSLNETLFSIPNYIRPSTSSTTPNFVRAFSFLPIAYCIERVDYGEIEDFKLQQNENLTIQTKKRVLLDLVMVNDVSTKTFVDASVLHGRIYKYIIKKVYYVEQLDSRVTLNGITNERIGYFISSSPIDSINDIAKTIVDQSYKTINPIDFRFYRKNSDLYIDCNYPIQKNEKIPIVKFLLFKRKNLNNSFTLIQARSCFNDKGFKQLNYSLKKFKNEINANLSNLTLFKIKDYNFKQGEILTACTVDVHGNISNYGIQYKIEESFPESNRLKIEMISKSGAPLSNPNLLLDYPYSNIENVLNGTVGISNIKSIEFIPTYGLFSSVNPDSRNSRIPISKISKSFSLIPTHTKEDSDKILLNIISIGDEESSTIEINFKNNNITEE